MAAEDPQPTFKEVSNAFFRIWQKSNRDPEMSCYAMVAGLFAIADQLEDIKLALQDRTEP